MNISSVRQAALIVWSVGLYSSQRSRSCIAARSFAAARMAFSCVFFSLSRRRKNPFVRDKPHIGRRVPCCWSPPKCDAAGIFESEHQSVFLPICLCQQSTAGSLSALTAVYLPRGNNSNAATTPRAAKLVSRGLRC